MGRKLYVGNLSYNVGETELQELFSTIGDVENVTIMRDHATGQARGFGFVEMRSEEDAQRAATELNEREFVGRRLTVNEARPKPQGSFGGGGGGGRGGFGGGGNGGGNRRREPRW
jgi:RNA recognition motif-containing protein